MADFTFKISTEHNVYPNLTVYDRFYEGNQRGWKVTSNEGYVMYDTTDENFDLVEDPETGEMIEQPVTYYYTLAYLPRTFNWTNFTWAAIPRCEVDEKYIFGS